MMRSVVAAILLMSLSWASASDNEGRYSSIGAASCGAFIEGQKKAHIEQLSHLSWVGGYLTRYNYGVRDTYDVLGNADLTSVMLWIENYCKANPLKNMNDAMIELIRELRPKRYRSAKDAGK